MPAIGSEQVVLVSDRGPVRFAGTPAAGLRPTPRNGSVTVLLDRIARSLPGPVTWVAPSAADEDARAARLGLLDRLAVQLGYRYDVVPVSPDDYDRYYYDVGVSILWTAWHGIEDEVPIRLAGTDPGDPLAGYRTALAGYRTVNRALADRVCATAEPGAAVSIHDYQLMLMPGMIRRRRPDLRVAHFSHTPFPGQGSLSQLPPTLVRSVVDGMLGADLLGFQRPRWAWRFLRCCERLGMRVDREHGLVRHGPRRTWVRCYPVTVDSAALAARARTRSVTRWAERTRAEDPRRIIARVDRLDPAKNALRGFEAYARLLHRRPELARQVRFVACLVPSREHLPDYRDYATRVRQVIQQVNQHHANAITVHYGDDPDRALGVLRVHDVLLVNPVSDGMNLVAQEGVLINGNDGVAVLSAGAGAADLLPGTLPLADPVSVPATENALETALGLSPPQRRAHAGRARAAVAGASPASWFDHQLTDLRAVRAGGAPAQALP